MKNKNWYVSKSVWHKANGNYDVSDYLITNINYHKALKVYSSEINNIDLFRNNIFENMSVYYDTITIDFGWYTVDEDGVYVDGDILYTKEFKR